MVTFIPPCGTFFTSEETKKDVLLTSRRLRSARCMEMKAPSKARPLDAPTQIRTAKVYTTGRKISLEKVKRDLRNWKGEEALYLICSGCETAYVGNTIGINVEGEVKVACPVCKETFVVDPKGFYVEALTEVGSNDREALRNKKRKEVEGAMGCEHFGQCGGCSLNTQVDRPPVTVGLARYFRKYLGYTGLFQFKMGEMKRWRTHSKLAVRGSVGRLGLFGMSSHELVRIPGCLVHHPQINKAVEVLEDVFRQFEVKGYDEDTFEGHARYVVLTVERDSDKVQLTIVWNSKDAKGAAPFAQTVSKYLWKHQPDLWHSIYFNWNTARSNVILNGSRCAWTLRYGQPYIKESILGVDLFFSPSTFIQANLTGFSDLLWEMLKHTPSGMKRAAELYCGTGTIGLVLAAKGRISSLVASEFNPACAGPWNHAAALIARKFEQAGCDAPSLTFFAEEAAESTDLLSDADLVIVNPPRRGLDSKVLGALTRAGYSSHSPIQRLIYVSCSVPNLKEDAKQLVENGWSVQYASSWVLFPGSNHVETLCIMDAPGGGIRYRGR